MPPADSSALIVARFLKANRYEESYRAFVDEAGLSDDAGTIKKGDLTLEVLLEEKRTFDLSVKFEKLGTEDDAGGWSRQAPEVAKAVDDLPSKSNVLSVTVADIASEHGSTSMLFASSADRRLHAIKMPGRQLHASLAGLQDSPILSSTVVKEQYLLTTSMSGQLLASDLEGNVLDRRRDHSKYAVKVITLDNPTGQSIIATAGWDCKVNIYRPTISRESFEVGKPGTAITLQSKPEAILFASHPDNGESILLITRTDSNHIYYYTTESEPRLLGTQNLAPHSNAWVAFTPSALALHPSDPSLIAIATSTVPHMKLLIVRLLVPPYDGAPTSTRPAAVRTSLLDDTPATETQASQARAALAVADREDAAIQIHCTTFAPQTAYSTPAVAWRPDGSGVWVNGDDGAIRGIEASTGKVILRLQGHEEGSKVRCLWAGEVDGEELLVSGGFDQQLIVWRAQKAEH